MTASIVPLTPEPGLNVDPRAILAVIPTLNEEAHIETCIRSLMTGPEGTRDIPLIIADGGSHDKTVEIVEGLMSEFPNLELLENPDRLQAAALNRAAKHAVKPETRHLVRCDAHSIYPPGFILKVAGALVKTGAASVVIPMDAVGYTCFEKANAWIVDTPLGSGGAAHRGGRKSGYVDHGHHAGFSLAKFQELGGYDESFSHNEDAEYDQRVAKSGGAIYLDATIRIQYIPRGSVRRLWSQYYGYGKGRARNIRKHGQALKVRQLLPILALLASVLGTLCAPFFWPSLILPLGYIGVLGLASILMALGKKSVCGLYAGLASGTMHMAWASGFLSEKISPTKTGNA